MATSSETDLIIRCATYEADLISRACLEIKTSSGGIASKHTWFLALTLRIVMSYIAGISCTTSSPLTGSTVVMVSMVTDSSTISTFGSSTKA